jgi:hypothetical protein
MVNAIEIASNALILIGDSPITAWDETGGGVAAEAVYSVTKKSLLSAYPWSFAMKNIRLSQNAAAPDALLGYGHSHAMPSDMIRLWRLLPEGMNYIIRGTDIYSNYTDILAEYTYDCDENLFPDYFREAFEFLLASKLGNCVTENPTIAEAMLTQHKMQLAIAKNTDSTQKPQIQIQDAPFNRVRQGGQSSSYFVGG